MFHEEKTVSGKVVVLVMAALALAVAGIVFISVKKKPPVAPAPIEKPVEPPKPEPKVTKINVPRPTHVRGIYLTAWSAGSRSKMTRVLDLLDRTELNSLVIDIRDAGIVYWKTGIELADKSGATRIGIVYPDELMARLEKRKAYPIARIACFRDNFVPKRNPELSVQNAKGLPWKDGGGYTWLDPYNKKNWEYLASIVDFALDRGFPEIQLDYVRFPSEGKKQTMRFPAKKTYGDGKASFDDVIPAFATFIGERVRARQAEFSADIFGIISSSSTRDQGIGQTLEKVAEPFDMICPMVYPSHFNKGEYGIKDPSASPGSIVAKSLKDFARRLPNKKIRPWLQDFFGYGKAQVQAQIKAAKTLGYEEYLLWNARNIYTESAVIDNSGLIAKKK